MTFGEVDLRREVRAMRRRRPWRQRRMVALNGWLWSRLPMPRVFIYGRRWRQFLVNGSRNEYDFAEDVRELVLEQIRVGVYADWSDPRDWLPLPARKAR